MPAKFYAFHRGPETVISRQPMKRWTTTLGSTCPLPNERKDKGNNTNNGLNVTSPTNNKTATKT